MSARPPAAPQHLSAAAGKLFGQIVAAYVLEPHHLAVLVKALEAWDRAESARLLVERDGPVITSRLGNLAAHPAVAIERDSRAAFMAGIKALHLDLESAPPSSSSRRY